MRQLGTLTPFPPAGCPALAAIPPGRWLWRGLRGEDHVWLTALYASTREQELQAVPWPASAKQQFLAQQFAAQHQHYLAHYPQAHYLAIECDGQVAGRYYIDETGEDDLLVDISLFPQWRGRGIGRSVIACQQQASAARGRGLALHVLIHNTAAQRLYERMGFVAMATPQAGLYLPMRWQQTTPDPACTVS